MPALHRRGFLAAALSAATAAVTTPSLAQQALMPRRNPEVYMLRGFADVFSEGLDQMGAGLRTRGIDAHVQGHMTWRSVASRIIEDRRQGVRGPVVLVGHSLGANAIIRVAETLEKEGIAVDLLVSLAATAPRPLPPNVRRAVNYYFSAHGWGEPLVPGPGFRGRLQNKDYAGIAEIGHFNIDKQRAVQSEIMGLTVAAVR